MVVKNPVLSSCFRLGEGDCRPDVAARGGDLGVVFGVGVVRGAGFGAGDLSFAKGKTYGDTIHEVVPQS